MDVLPGDGCVSSGCEFRVDTPRLHQHVLFVSRTCFGILHIQGLTVTVTLHFLGKMGRAPASVRLGVAASRELHSLPPERLTLPPGPRATAQLRLPAFARQLGRPSPEAAASTAAAWHNMPTNGLPCLCLIQPPLVSPRVTAARARSRLAGARHRDALVVCGGVRKYTASRTRCMAAAASDIQITDGCCWR
jgi:hypothetical protein